MKQNKKIDNKRDWANFTMGYLRLAELAFQEMSDGKYNASENEEFKIEEIYIPALFNLKHAVEILLKLFSMEFLDEKVFDGSYYSHDIEQLFLALRKKVGEKRLNKVIKEYEKKHPDSKEKLSGKNIFDELENIVKTYHNLIPLKAKIGVDFTIRDPQNDALRYPINNLEISINYENISKKFKREDVWQPLIDSIRLQTIFWKLYNLIYIEQISRLGKF